jgi:hypothetical protein
MLAAVLLISCTTYEAAATSERPRARADCLARDGFEGPTLEPFWLAGDHGSGRFAQGAVVLTQDQARSGRGSARITVRQGDVAQLGDSGQANERAELDSGKRRVLGQDLWCGFSFLVPPDFPVEDVRLVLSQWKQSELEGSPIVAQRFRAGQHYLTVRDVETSGQWSGVFELPAIVPGKWHDMVFHVRFAHDSSGFVDVWMDGAAVVCFAGPTASPRGAETFYHKVGLYRDTMQAPMTIHVDNYTLGSSFDAVDPSRWP